MTWKQALAFLYAQLPMYHRIGPAAYKNNLDNISALDQLTGFPHRSFNTIHIAGTNGKGSVSSMLSAILQTAGYKTGLFTSPHLKDFRERIRINGKMISRSYICRFIEKHKSGFENIKPSFFEWTTILAFDYFRHEKVDIAVIETGLGGRLDSTNIITPLLSVITNIGWDHAELLGNSLKKIASEKAGIIKPRIPVVIGEYQKEVFEVFRKKASDNNSPLICASDHFKITELNPHRKPWEKMKVRVSYPPKPVSFHIYCDLTGHYQLKNIATVLQSAYWLKKHFQLSDKHIRTALSHTRSLTGFSGRWTVIRKRPLIIADVAHNADGIKEVIDQLKKTKFNRLHFVFGLVQDKDAEAIFNLLPKDAEYYFCKPSVPRGMDSRLLCRLAAQSGINGKAYKSVKAAMQAAIRKAAPDDLIYAGGSTFVVAEVI